MRVHELMLVQVAEERADMSSQIHIILDTVRKKAASVSEIRQEIEKEIAEVVIANEEIATSTDSVLDTEQELEIDIGTTTTE